MVPPRTRLAALAALAVCAALPAAPAQAGVLVAQLAQVETVPELPPLGEPPDELGGNPEAEPTPEPAGGDEPDEASPGIERLADTGAEPLVAALAGLGLVVAGLGLRRTSDDLFRS